MRALAAQAGLLHPAEGCGLGGDQAGIDADDPTFERLGAAPDPSYIPAKEITSEAELGIISDLNSLLSV